MKSLRNPTDRALSHYHRANSEVQTYLAVAKQLQTAYQYCQSEFQRRFGYTVFVDVNDLVFSDVLAKLRADIPTSQQRVLVATSSTQHGWDEFLDEEVVNDAHVDLGFGGGMNRTVTIEGHRMRVATPEASARPDASRPGLYFFARSVAGRDAVVNMLSAMAEKRVVEPELRDPNLYVYSSNYWNRSVVPFRPIESVILPDGQLERITDDLGEFLDNERFYVRRSIPWHRGYLFHGPPGTGKTSLVRGLAKRYGLDLYAVPLGDLKRDADLVGCVSAIRQRAILLLEDVDVYGTARSRKAQDGKASLSGLLNTLDGVSTPHGLITVLTTNHIDVIDSALLRPGRVDLVEELTAPDGDQITRLFAYFYERQPDTDLTGIKASSVAAITEVFKRHLHDAAAAEAELLEKGAVEAPRQRKPKKTPTPQAEPEQLTGYQQPVRRARAAS